jgi:hypothetical protein
MCKENETLNINIACHPEMHNVHGIILTNYAMIVVMT